MRSKEVLAWEQAVAEALAVVERQRGHDHPFAAVPMVAEGPPAR
jgi:hypothetical protein